MIPTNGTILCGGILIPNDGRAFFGTTIFDRPLAWIIHESGRILRRLLHTSPTRKRVNFAAFTRLRFGLVCDHE